MYQRYERFTFAISEISRYLHRLTAGEMEKYGLKTSHGTYLLALARNPKGLTAQQLCETCSKNKSDVSRMMRIMEEKGLVQKCGTYLNGYGGAFQLTEAGLELAGHIRARASQAVEFAGKDLSEAQRDAFYKALDSIAANLRNMSKEGL